MKKKTIHIPLDNEALEELERLNKVTGVCKAKILDEVIKNGFKRIRELNDNFTQFIKERSE